MKLRLLVIRCIDIEKSKRFYETLGITFIKESHDGGPDHYSSEMGDLVFELYPASVRYPVCKTRLGFEASVPMEKLKLNALDSYIANNQTVYVLEDPDGRKVDMY